MSFTDPFGRILVAYDASPAADAALAQAVALAEQFAGDVVIVHVSDLWAPTVFPLATNAPKHVAETGPAVRGLDLFRRDLLAHAAERVASCTVPVTVEFSTNRVVAGVLDAAERWSATAIAVGTRDLSDIARTLTGSKSHGILRNANVPVIVARDVPGVRAGALRRLVVGVDHAQPSEGAALFAVALALRRDIRLVFCSVAEAPVSVAGEHAVGSDPTPFLDGLRAVARGALDAGLQFAHAVDVYPDTEVVESAEAANGLIQAARHQRADAIVVGTHGRRHLDRVLLGSTAEGVARRSELPVIVVPARANLVAGTLRARAASR